MRYDSDQGTVYAELDDSTQYATVYECQFNRPVGTLRRRHAFDARGAPRWQLWHVDSDKPVRSWHMARDYQGIVNDSAKALARAREGN